VSKQMGHAKPSITSNIYADLIEKRRPAAAALTDENLFGKAVATPVKQDFKRGSLFWSLGFRILRYACRRQNTTATFTR